jgi:hypothetical protein
MQMVTTGASLQPANIPLTVSSQSELIIPTKLFDYDGCLGWVYEVLLEQKEDDVEVTYSIGDVKRKFYLCGYNVFNAAFFSCNGRKRLADEIALESAGGIAERWQVNIANFKSDMKDVYQEMTKRKTSLLIGMGDQLYMDFYDSMDEMARYLNYQFAIHILDFTTFL